MTLEGENMNHNSLLKGLWQIMDNGQGEFTKVKVQGLEMSIPSLDL